ncbi:MAG: hypothetical protein ABSF09_05850 [Candidatus Bathyarchaeia archaeon]
MPNQSPIRFTTELSPDAAKLLDTLKGMSGRKSRNAVLEDLISIVYYLIKTRATETDRRKMMEILWVFVDEGLKPYWEPYKQTTGR